MPAAPTVHDPHECRKPNSRELGSRRDDRRYTDAGDREHERERQNVSQPKAPLPREGQHRRQSEGGADQQSGEQLRSLVPSLPDEVGDEGELEQSGKGIVAAEDRLDVERGQHA